MRRGTPNVKRMTVGSPGLEAETGFVNGVLGKDIRAGTARYDLVGYGVWTNEAREAVEYGAVVNLSEQDRRQASGGTAYLDGQPTTNVTPMTEFCFGIRKGNQAVRLDFEPACWVGGVIRVGQPEALDRDMVVKVQCGIKVILPQVASNMMVETTYSLKSLSRVGYAVKSAMVYDGVAKEMRIYRDGKLEATEPFVDMGENWFMAKGTVRDEKGVPVAEQDVVVAWENSWMISATESKSKHFSDTLRTDGNGYFEKKITGTTECNIRVNRPGYWGMRFQKRRDEFPLDIQLRAVPPAATNLGASVSWGRKTNTIEIKSLRNCRAVGLSMETYDSGGRIGIKGWTTNKAEADVWIEVGETEEDFQQLFNRCVTTNRLKSDWREWPVRMTGLRGTVLKEAPDAALDGLSIDATLAEADADGYSGEVTGLARPSPGSMLGYDWSGKHVLSRNFYFCKGGKYGRLIGLENRFSGEGEIRPITKTGKPPALPGDSHSLTDPGMRAAYGCHRSCGCVEMK